MKRGRPCPKGRKGYPGEPHVACITAQCRRWVRAGRPGMRAAAALLALLLAGCSAMPLRSFRPIDLPNTCQANAKKFLGELPEKYFRRMLTIRWLAATASGAGGHCVAIYLWSGWVCGWDDAGARRLTRNIELRNDATALARRWCGDRAFAYAFLEKPEPEPAE